MYVCILNKVQIIGRFLPIGENVYGSNINIIGAVSNIYTYNFKIV